VDIPAGTTTAIVGETGAGKTTLGYLVSRLYDVTEGRVIIDGVDIRELTFASLASAVGVVSQETYLFNSTVRENLRFANRTRMTPKWKRLPRGSDPRVDLVAAEGTRPSSASAATASPAGKTAYCIARAILRNPPILVLDEATSALDTQTERMVQEALARLVEGRTTIAIAHRLSTIRDADQIVVLDGAVLSRSVRTMSCSRAAAATRRWPPATRTRCSSRARRARLAADRRAVLESCRSAWPCDNERRPCCDRCSR